MCRGIEMWANHIKVFTVIQTVTEELNHQNVNCEVLNKFNRQIYEQHIIQMCVNYQQFGEWSVVIVMERHSISQSIYVYGTVNSFVFGCHNQSETYK